MLIKELSRLTNLTKKAIEYYSEQGLVYPTILENGYRDYNQDDIERLKKIAVLRKLDISTVEIFEILNDKTDSVLQKILVKKELEAKREKEKTSILEDLSSGESYEEINKKLCTMDQFKKITDKLLDSFPGYYGRFICMHFAGFLNEAIETKSQQEAYETIVEFLDNLPDFNIPEDLQEYFDEGTKNMGIQQISKLLSNTQDIFDNPDDYLENNKELLAKYLEFKQSSEYQNSPAAKLAKLMKDFNRSNGYNDVFIPAMRKLSVSYAEYYKKLESVNEKLIKKHPEYNNIAE